MGDSGLVFPSHTDGWRGTDARSGRWRHDISATRFDVDRAASTVHDGIATARDAHATSTVVGCPLVHDAVRRRSSSARTGQPHGCAVRSSDRPAYDFDPLLAAMKPLVSSADLAICHMETPVAPNQAQITTYPVFGAPVGLVKAIRDTGYDGCSTASNHSLDKGKAGILATVAAFNSFGLGHTGTYVSAKDAMRIQMYDVKGVKVAHLSYAYGFNGIPIPADAPYSVHEIDVQRILSEAKRARAAGAQFVVLSLHWGNEYQPAPNAQQLAISPALTASPDIDLIVGHHVHVVQPIVSEHGKFVVFGMGNQLSNQHEDLQRDGLTVLVTVARKGNGRYAATRSSASRRSSTTRRYASTRSCRRSPTRRHRRPSQPARSLLRPNDGCGQQSGRHARRHRLRPRPSLTPCRAGGTLQAALTASTLSSRAHAAAWSAWAAGRCASGSSSSTAQPT